MKIIYLKNTGGHKRGEVKEVAEGYFRNFLSAQRLATLATPESINQIKNELGKQTKQKLDVLADIKKMADKIRHKKIEIKGKANEFGKLYGAVSDEDIKKELKRLGLKIGEAKIIGAHHLKEAGDYTVTVDFGHAINSTIKVAVRV